MSARRVSFARNVAGSITRALVVAVVVVACGAARPPLPPTHVVPLPANEWGEFALDVFDSTRLVTGGHFLVPANAVGDAKVTARPNKSEIDVTWTGGACAHRPILTIRGRADDLRLEIIPAPAEFSLSPGGCPAVGISFGVTLTLDQAVDQAAVHLTEFQ